MLPSDDGNGNIDGKLDIFIFTVFPMYHGVVLSQKTSKQLRFCGISVKAIIFELDYNFSSLRKVGNLLNVRLKKG